MQLKHRRLLPSACILALLGGGGPAWAQSEDLVDLPFEELLQMPVIQTPKFAVSAEFTPSAVSTLTRADIRAFGWRTLADALRSLNGYTVSNDHTYAYVGVRGIAAPGDYRNRMQLLVDGIAVNENIYGSASVDSAFPVDIDLIEQIDVIRGPSASVYGGDSALGVINVVTRAGSSLQGMEVSASAGSGRAGEGRISWGKRSESGGDFLLSYTGSSVSGRPLDLPENAAAGYDATLRGVGGENSGKFFLRYRSEDWRATLIHSVRDRSVPTGSFETLFNDGAHREADNYTLAEVGKDWQISRATSLHARLYAGQYEYKGDFPYDYPPRVLNRDRATGQWWGWESRLLSTAWQGHRWIAGIEYKANVRQDQINDDQGYGCFGVGTQACLNDRRQSEQGSLYLQDEILVGAATYLTLGTRLDKSSTTAAHWSPRLGLVHQNERGGIFKMLYATAFSDPTVYQKYYRPATFAVGNPELQPERMRSLEFSWDQRLGPHSRFSSSLYFFRVQDLVGIAASSGQYVNYPAIDGRGLELEFQQRWPGNAQLRAGYTLQQMRLSDGALENVPRHVLHANLALPLGASGWLAGLEGQMLSRRRTGKDDSWVPAYGIANLNLSYRPLGQAWDASLGIYNLFDHRYADPVALETTLAGERDRMPQLGRSFRLKLTVRF
ncbi:TonB-dependent receptor plug domain-containing protein [Quatrionicoccus australiensis]|uniref:TonB-dependent receptor plug domain-containing protein n=1 Tax=Quatrionicoccus australiensis TaxID=138118 RepID=UPI001CF8B5FA|nr:TonB-dependent receptor [Quatrionicoccus australiensis]UCV14188.1 TonB-dependent receptor [Quatrionicoccus australiensis]